LMVSRFSYYSFKDLDLRERVPFVTLLVVVLVFVFLSIETATVLFSFFFLYMLSGPIISLFRWNRNRMRLSDPNEETPTKQ
jgi:CDP-diacylglycerol--serine O-phosphatidyltransferase